MIKALAEVFGRPFALNGVHFAGRTDGAIVPDLILANGLPPAEIERGMAAVFQAFPRHMRSETEICPSIPCPGIPQLLETLVGQNGICLSLLTGNLQTTASIKLASAGIAPALFRFGAFGDDSADRNALPPIALRRAAGILGKKPAPTAIVVGDTPADIECAQANNLRALAVATGPYSVAELAAHRPDHLFPDLTDLDRVLRVLVL